MKNKAFIFPGQGSQTIGMAKNFYENFNVAKEVFEKVDNTLNKNLTKIMFEGPDEILTDTKNSQPAIMVASVAILEVLKQQTNLKIDELCNVVAGHSLGEYTALYAAESLTLENTAALLKVRGEAFAKAGENNKGAMAALIGATIEQAEEVIKKSVLKDEILEIANDNTVGQIVISGNQNSVEKAIEIAIKMKIKKAIKLQVSGAFHSRLMNSAIEEMQEILKSIEIKKPKVNIIANYNVKFEDNIEDIKQNLLNQITGRVKWRETMLKMEDEGIKAFIEIGNGKVLSGMVPRTCPNVKAFSINSLESLDEFIKNYL